MQAAICSIPANSACLVVSIRVHARGINHGGVFASGFSPNEKSRFYRMAKRSGTETAAILDVAKRLDIIHEDNYQKGRELLIRIIMMLTKLAQKTN